MQSSLSVCDASQCEMIEGVNVLQFRLAGGLWKPTTDERRPASGK